MTDPEDTASYGDAEHTVSYGDAEDTASYRDPEDTVSYRPADLAEAEADLGDEFERPMPLEADDADAVDQKRDVPADEEDYPE